MFRLASAAAAVCVALAVGTTSAKAFQCLSAEERIEDLKALQSNAERLSLLDPVTAAAGFAIADLDLVFEGKLDKATELVASGGRLLTLFKFKQVRWLKGPQLGRTKNELKLLTYFWCEGCKPRGLAFDGSISQVWAGRWPRTADIVQAKSSFNVVPDVVAQTCDRLPLRSSEPDIQKEFDRQIFNMRRAADHEAEAIKTYRKK